MPILRSSNRTRRTVASIRRSGWQVKRFQARPARTLDQQVALLGASMQSEALSIAPPIDVASPIAATAITLPITARIQASSRSEERRVGKEWVSTGSTRWAQDN